MSAIRVTCFILICYINGYLINGWLLPQLPNVEEASDIHQRRIASSLGFVLSMTIDQNGNFLYISQVHPLPVVNQGFLLRKSNFEINNF